jgi:hypothetical protein
MRIEELEELMAEDPGEAEAEFAELVSNANVEQLAHIAEHAPGIDVQLRAIEGLGEVGGSEASAVLVEMLETVNTPFVIGGTEQQLAHAARQAGLIQAVARTRAVSPPSGQSQNEIAEFIESVRRG